MFEQERVGVLVDTDFRNHSGYGIQSSLLKEFRSALQVQFRTFCILLLKPSESDLKARGKTRQWSPVAQIPKAFEADEHSLLLTFDACFMVGPSQEERRDDGALSDFGWELSWILPVVVRCLCFVLPGWFLL